MRAPDARVSDLVAEGRITPEEGERLRRALQGDADTWRIVRNPVEYLRPSHAAMGAAAIVVASLAISQLDVRFDGALDMHRVVGTPRWSVAVLDQFVAVGLTALVLWVASLVVVRQGRLQDFVVAVSLGRLPTLLGALWAIAVLPPPAEMVRQATSGQVSAAAMVGIVGTLPFLLWKFVWLYRGFAVSAGMGGAKAAVTFAVAIFAAEVLSKLVLRALL